ncbi:glycosyltransferase [Hyunsoonleella sp. SJ7]|uniref:Glycosyltransferase n=1 Tax=Hyunsoonleella aquatilis TaxID=2762758 RepID=A0A923KIR0_9FLAO|nr:glycosyltransferase [Hyunsoonleella aquatilis]MBC3759024.1 glycosyltransferase [Hyunsoonleella aquatilis]
MKLSILIPMYNSEELIGNCLDSLLIQNLPKEDYEIIIIDDESSDKSVEIVQDYAKKYTNISLVLQKNAGTFTTRNRLLKLAKGDYIYNLDADDYIVHHCLGDLLAIAENNDLDIIGFKSNDTVELDEFELTETIDPKSSTVTTGTEFLEANPHYTFAIWWYFVKRDLLEEKGTFFNDNQYSADVMFTTTLFLGAKKMTVLPNEIHRYVLTPDSLMRSDDYEIISKRVNNFHAAALSMNGLIKCLNAESAEKNDGVIRNLKFRRDVLSFFNITDMIAKHFPIKDIKAKIEDLKREDAFPLSYFIGETYNSPKYRVLTFVINNKKLLYLILSVKSIFFKTR